jgi:hypothetical protein
LSTHEGPNHADRVGVGDYWIQKAAAEPIGVDFKAPTKLMLPISSKPDPRNNCSPSQSRQLHAALSAMDPMRRNLHDQHEETLLGTPLGTKARSRSIAGMSGKLGRRAVVVGAGIGGLSAAGVLAKYFDQVDVLERDQTPLSAETRSGTPQDSHAHGLLAGGLQALNEIYLDFDRDLAAAGAVCVNVPGDIRYEKRRRRRNNARHLRYAGRCHGHMGRGHHRELAARNVTTDRLYRDVPVEGRDLSLGVVQSGVRLGPMNVPIPGKSKPTSEPARKREHRLFATPRQHRSIC